MELAPKKHLNRGICDRLWENPAKVARQNSEKRGKEKTIFFLEVYVTYYGKTRPKSPGRILRKGEK
jgi:hypothetical protein